MPIHLMTDTPDEKKCVLLLCGPPGCGKTTVTKELAVDFARKGVRSAIVSYDDDIDPRLISREEDWNDKSFGYNRGIHKELINAKLKESDVDIVIVDDIMYLCSMRRELYTLARSHNAALVCIQLSASLSTILYRNSLRHGRARISENTIIKIHGAFENVDAKRTAEKYSIVVSTEDINENRKCIKSGERVENSGTYLSSCIPSAIQNLYFASVRCPQDLGKSCYEEESGGISDRRDNFYIHELDLILRKQVGSIMKSSISDGFCRKFHDEVRKVKAEMMKDFTYRMKCQRVDLPRREIEDALNKYKTVFQKRIHDICKFR